MKTFEIGKTYYMRSIGNHECVWNYTVTARTASTVTLEDDEGKTIKCRINKGYSEDRNAETVFPLGRYSMCPVLSADREVKLYQNIECGNILTETEMLEEFAELYDGNDPTNEISWNEYYKLLK